MAKINVKATRQRKCDCDGGVATAEAEVSEAAAGRWGGDNITAAAAAQRWRQWWKNGGGKGNL